MAPTAKFASTDQAQHIVEKAVQNFRALNLRKGTKFKKLYHMVHVLRSHEGILTFKRSPSLDIA